MGEKPLSIDETPIPTATIGGVAPGTMPGGVDAPPPGMVAGSIITTRSNIKNVAGTAPPPIGGPGAGTPAGVTDEAPPPDMSGGATIITTRSNIKSASSVAGPAGDVGADRPPPIDGDGGGGTADSPSDASEAAIVLNPSEGPRGSGSKSAAASAQSDGAGVAAESDPIPGLDVKLGKNPGGAAANIGPVKPEPTRPADPIPADAGPAGLAIKEQGIKHGDGGGDATPAVDAPEVAGRGNPIPGVDVIVKKDPPR
jgi:hypothetical protein